jgi:hypothetical protein
MKDSSESRKGQATYVKRRSGYVMDHYQQEPPEPVINIETPPRGAVLDVWFQNSWDNGTQIDELEEMQRIQVRTVYSLYEITVIDGGSGEILVKGGEHIPDLTEGQLTGATLGGSFCKMRGIYPGFKMEFVANGKRLVTSTVQTVSVFHAESLQEYGNDSRTAI